MKADIHPKYDVISVHCSCGHSFQTKSTLCKDLKVDVCSKCHPHYTGQQKIVDTEGRVESFKKRFAQFSRK
jgi:large subunit ribosomal protein L31